MLRGRVWSMSLRGSSLHLCDQSSPYTRPFVHKTDTTASDTASRATAMFSSAFRFRVRGRTGYGFTLLTCFTMTQVCSFSSSPFRQMREVLCVYGCVASPLSFVRCVRLTCCPLVECILRGTWRGATRLCVRQTTDVLPVTDVRLLT